jgi:acetyl esterase/lipase
MTRNDRPHNPDLHYGIQEVPPPADTSHITRKFINIPYAGLSNSQKLDIYLPEQGNGPFPVIVSIHGGAFMGCDKGDVQVMPMLEGVNKGFAVISINYRLSGEAKFPALVQDGKAAIRWIRGNAEKYGFDPRKIVAWGGSAGGYLASMLAVSADNTYLEDLTQGYAEYSSNVQAAVIWYAPTNFLKMDEHLMQSGLTPPPEQSHNGENSPESLLLGEKITKIPERVKEANPETYITENIPPMLLQHGRKDPVVPVQQSIEFFEKLNQKAGARKIILEIFEEAEHADPAFETKENVERVFRFLKDNQIY